MCVHDVHVNLCMCKKHNVKYNIVQWTGIFKILHHMTKTVLSIVVVIFIEQAVIREEAKKVW